MHDVPTRTVVCTLTICSEPVVNPPIACRQQLVTLHDVSETRDCTTLRHAQSLSLATRPSATYASFLQAVAKHALDIVDPYNTATDRMGGKPSRPPEPPVPPVGYEAEVKGSKEPQTAPPPGWYWSHETYFTCPGLLCFCCCEQHKWVLKPEAAKQPQYTAGTVAQRAPDGQVYVTPAIEGGAFNGPAYGEPIVGGHPLQAAASGMPQPQKTLPQV